MSLINDIIAFYSHPFFVIFGGISATILLIGVLLNFIFWLMGITPLLLRLGYGRWFRKIAVVAKPDMYSVLKKDLTDSGIFREKNISSAITEASISDVKNHDLLLVHYQSFNEDQIKSILSNKKSNAGMIFYFPEFSPENRISDHIRDEISNTPNTTLVNFRGRLLNDIITTLITTSYEKR